MKTFGLITLIIIILALIPWMFMVAWNYGITFIFDVPKINFFHSMAILAVSNLLFAKTIKLDKND